MPDLDLKCRELCGSNGLQLVKTFQALAKSHGTETLTANLIEALERESITPYVVGTWLSCCEDVNCVIILLSCSCRLVRKDALKAVKRWLRGSDWRDMWACLGGTKGILDFLAQLSLDELSVAIAALRKSVPAPGIPREPGDNRRALITKLTKCLFSRIFPEARHSNPDDRQLQTYYIQLLPACTEEFFLENLGRGLAQTPWIHWVFQSTPALVHHCGAIREAILQSLGKDDTFSKNVLKLCRPLLRDYARSCSGSLWSESMTFSWELLSAVHKTNSSAPDGISIIQDLVMPLLHRLTTRKRKYCPKEPSKVLSLILEHAQSNRKLVHQFGNGFDQHSFRVLVVKFWSRDQVLYDSILKDMLRLLGDETPCSHYQSDMTLAVPQKLRYVFVKLLWQYALEQKVNVMDTQELQAKAAKIQVWDPQLFLSLEPEDGLDLLERLQRAANGNPDIIGRHPSLPCNPPLSVADREPRGDIQLLRLKLAPPSAEITSVARKLVENLQSAAVKGRTQEVRRDFALLVGRYSRESQDVKLLHDSLEWSMRFMRDPITSRAIFASGDSTFISDTASLLSGISEFQTGTEEAASQSITQGNEILRLWLRIVVDSSRQPHFGNDGQAICASGLFDEVAKLRFCGASEVQTRLNLDDNQLYELIFEPTLRILVEAETLSLSLDNDPLYVLRAPRSNWLTKPKIVGSAAWRFVDQLAETRDAYWARKRRERNPEVATLQHPWPQGLTIRLMLPIHPSLETMEGAKLPYLEARAKRIVFSKASEVCIEIPVEPRQTTVFTQDRPDEPFDQFIDEYKLALQVFIFTAQGLENVHSNMIKAWKHATTELSTDLTSSEWIAARWSKAFREAVGDELFDRYLPSAPSLTSEAERNNWVMQLPDDDGMTNYWSPAENKPRTIRSMRRPAMIIDTLLNFEVTGSYYSLSPQYSTISTRGLGHTLSLPEFVPTGIFTSSRLKNKKQRDSANLEALIAASILWLDLHRGGSKSVLADGYPAAGQRSQRRFPPLVLDPEFGYEDDPSLIRVLDRVLSILCRSQRRLPTKLLVSLANEMFQSLESQAVPTNKLAIVERVFYRIVNMIVGSPAATPLVSQAITKLPESSHLHRMIMNPRLLKRLSPAQAREVMYDFNRRVAEVNQRRQEFDASESEPGLAEKPPHVKITSIKMVASLLADSCIFSTSTAVDILAEILKKNTHPDVRVASVDAICGLLTSASPSEQDGLTVSKIEDTLSNISPIISALSERSGNTDPWNGWNSKCDLPEISHDREIYNSLLRTAGDYQRTKVGGGLSEHWRDFIATNLLVPAIEENMKAYGVWLAHFQQKYAAIGVEPVSGTILTTHPSMLSQFVKQMPERTPERLFDLLAGQTLESAERTLPDIIQRRDISEAKPEENRSWHLATAPEPDVNGVFSLLDSAWDWEVKSGNVKLSDVQAAAIAVAKAIIMHPGRGLQRWSNVVFALRPNLRSSPFDYRRWLRNSAPVARELAQFIDSLRTPDWQNNPQRQPPMLPGSFQLRAWLWRYPLEQQTVDMEGGRDNDANIARPAELEPLFGDLLRDLRAMLASGKVLLDDERKLLEDVFVNIQGNPRKRRLEIFMGDLRTEPPQTPAEMVLRVNAVASSVMKRSDLRQGGEECEKVVEQMVGEWLQEDNEEIRDKAWHLKSWMEDREGARAGEAQADVEW